MSHAQGRWASALRKRDAPSSGHLSDRPRKQKRGSAEPAGPASPMQDLLIDDMRRLLFREYLAPGAAVVFSMTCTAHYRMYQSVCKPMNPSADISHLPAGMVSKDWVKDFAASPTCWYVLEGYHMAIDEPFLGCAYPDVVLVRKLYVLVGDDRSYGWLSRLLDVIDFPFSQFPRPEHLAAVATPKIFDLLWQTGTATQLARDLTLRACVQYSNTRLFAHIVHTHVAQSGLPIHEWILPGLEHAHLRRVNLLFSFLLESYECFTIARDAYGPAGLDWVALASYLISTWDDFEPRVLILLCETCLPSESMLKDLGDRLVASGNTAALRALISRYPRCVAPVSYLYAIRCDTAAIIHVLAAQGVPLPDAPTLAAFHVLEDMSVTVVCAIIKVGMRIIAGTPLHVRIIRSLYSATPGSLTQAANLRELLTKFIDETTPAEAKTLLYKLIDGDTGPSREVLTGEHIDMLIRRAAQGLL